MIEQEMMAADWAAGENLLSGFRQRSHKPAKAKGASSFI
jgi:hypothetical protein